MLSASRRALQLLSSANPVRRMGDSASKVISAEEALPGRTEPIPVTGKVARLLSMRVEPAHSALPEEDVRDRGWVPGRSLRVRKEAANPPSPQFSRPPAREGRELSWAVSCLRASLCLSLALKDFSVGIDPARLLVCSSVFGASGVWWEPSLSLPFHLGL